MSVFDDTPNGDIFLSETYVRELGHAIGMVLPEKIAEVQNENAALERRVAKAEERWVQSADAFRSLVTMIANDPAQATLLAKQMLPKLEGDGMLHEAVTADTFATGPAYEKPKAARPAKK
jgi:hypothetical protein